jgi:hypothetical protein
MEALHIILFERGNSRVRSLPRTGHLAVVPQRIAAEHDGPSVERRTIERRTRTRFQLVFPVIFHWRDGTARSAVGYCRNIGLGGIFVLASTCPPINAEMEIDVVVPAFARGSSEILFRHTGRVIRIQACEDLLGFAVVGEFEHDYEIPELVTASTPGQR